MQLNDDFRISRRGYFRGRQALVWMVLSTLTVPAQVTLIPVFFILKNLNLLDTYPRVILPGFADVFGVFLMKQYIQTLPGEGLSGRWRVRVADLPAHHPAAVRAGPGGAGNLHVPALLR